jgi:hypothetical protein
MNNNEGAPGLAFETWDSADTTNADPKAPNLKSQEESDGFSVCHCRGICFTRNSNPQAAFADNYPRKAQNREVQRS